MTPPELTICLCALLEKLNEIKVGDNIQINVEVLGQCACTVMEVKEVTCFKIICSAESKFSRQTGKMIGYPSCYIAGKIEPCK